jgi:hypothetical protein
MKRTTKLGRFRRRVCGDEEEEEESLDVLLLSWQLAIPIKARNATPTTCVLEWNHIISFGLGLLSNTSLYHTS